MRKTILALILAALAASPAGATTLERMSLHKLTGVARVVVRARCVGGRSLWEGGEIWTLTRFTTIETFKGSPGASFTVRLIGGEVGGIESIVAGVPRFFAGEQVVLFLDPLAGGDYGVTAWTEGTFRVLRDAAGRRLVVRETPPEEVYDRATHRFRAPAARVMPLAAFRRRIERFARRGAAKGAP